MGNTLSFERAQILARVKKHREMEKVAEDYQHLCRLQTERGFDVGVFGGEFCRLKTEIYSRNPAPKPTREDTYELIFVAFVIIAILMIPFVSVALNN